MTWKYLSYMHLHVILDRKEIVRITVRAMIFHLRKIPVLINCWLTQNNRGVWGANGLGIASILNQYRNSNERWEQFYDLTVMVAISSPRRLNSVVGVLCVDSLRHLDVKKVGKILFPISKEIYNKMQVLFLAQAQVEGAKGFAASSRALLGWNCSTGRPSILNSEQQSLFQRAIKNAERGIDLVALTGARGRSPGGERPRAAHSPLRGDHMLSSNSLEELQLKLRELVHVGAEAVPDYVDVIGSEIYRQVGKELEKESCGKFVRIYVVTGSYVIGEGLLDALDKFESEFGDAPSWGSQIGAVVSA